MTNDEAEELIAEIKNSKDLNMLPVNPDGRPESRDFFNIQLLEKIINRFANKPPYTSCNIVGNDSTTIIKYNDFYRSIVIKQNKNSGVHETIYDKAGLIALRDNCTKMLDYLETP